MLIKDFFLKKRVAVADIKGWLLTCFLNILHNVVCLWEEDEDEGVKLIGVWNGFGGPNPVQDLCCHNARSGCSKLFMAVGKSSKPFGTAQPPPPAANSWVCATADCGHPPVLVSQCRGWEGPDFARLGRTGQGGKEQSSDGAGRRMDRTKTRVRTQTR